MLIRYDRLRDMGFKVDVHKTYVVIQPAHRNPDAEQHFRALIDSLHFTDHEADELMLFIDQQQVISAIRKS